MRVITARLQLAALAALLLVSTAGAACKKSATSPTTTTTTTTTTTVAAASNTDNFSAVVAVGGIVSYPFTVGDYGTVNANITSVTGTGVPTTVQMRLGMGTISDDGSCATSTAQLVRPSTTATAQITTTFTAGTYCVMVQDVGNLFRPATVAFNVAHP